MRYFKFFSRYAIQTVLIFVTAWVLAADSTSVLWKRTESLFWLSFLSLALIYVVALKRKKWALWFALGITFSLLESALILGFIGMTFGIIMANAPPIWPLSFYYFSLIATAAVFWFFHFVLSFALIEK